MFVPLLKHLMWKTAYQWSELQSNFCHSAGANVAYQRTTSTTLSNITWISMQHNIFIFSLLKHTTCNFAHWCQQQKKVLWWSCELVSDLRSCFFIVKKILLQIKIYLTWQKYFWMNELKFLFPWRLVTFVDLLTLTGITSDDSSRQQSETHLVWKLIEMIGIM